MELITKKIILAKRSTSSLPYLWITKGISKEDVLAYIGIRIYMGLHRLPSYKHYWNNNMLYQTDISKIMTKNYFLLIATSLHFPEKEKDDDLKSQSESNNKVDPRHKINLYLEKLAKNFQKYYVLGQNATIDESLLLFKGRNNMKFYIPMKPHKYGFKIHLLCDSDTNYLYNMLFDPGKTGRDFVHFDDNSSLSESIVLRLLSCLNDKKQRNIFFDGWYSSISLMKKLTKLGYLNTTVLRNNSRDLPAKIKLEGYDKAISDGIIIQKYEGRKTILFATNYEIDKEELRNIYNIKNRGVDTFDHYLEISSIQRRTKKWYKKIILFGIDASIINSKIICELRTGKSYTTVDFKEKLVERIFKMYKIYKKICDTKNDVALNEDELNEKKINRKKKIEENKSGFNNHCIGNIRNSKKKCQKCNEGTSYICMECGIGLHPECFIEYHKKFVFK